MSHNKNQPQVYPRPLPPGRPSQSYPSACHRALVSCLSHAAGSHCIYFMYGFVNSHVTLSKHLPFSLLPSPPCPEVCSLCLFLHCFPENKFISAIFLDSIYMCQYTVFMLFNIESIFCQLTHLLGSQLNICQCSPFLLLFLCPLICSFSYLLSNYSLYSRIVLESGMSSSIYGPSIKVRKLQYHNPLPRFGICQ